MANNAKYQTLSRGPITVDSVGESQYQKPGFLTAQLRQVVTTHSVYQGQRVSNERNGSMFSNEELGITDKEYDSDSNRVAFIQVPLTMTAEKLAPIAQRKYEGGATIYRVLSSKPIITEDQQWSIDERLKEYDDYAATQACRYPEGHKKAGQLMLDDNGNIYYRQTFYWDELVDYGAEGKLPRKDEDNRDKKGVDVYISEELLAELESYDEAATPVVTEGNETNDDLPF